MMFFPFAIWSEFSLLCHQSTERLPWKQPWKSNSGKMRTFFQTGSSLHAPFTVSAQPTFQTHALSQAVLPTSHEKLVYTLICHKWLLFIYCVLCNNGVLRGLALQTCQKYDWFTKPFIYQVSPSSDLKIGPLSTDFTIFHPQHSLFLTVYSYNSSRISYIWVKSLFFVISFEISTPLHQTPREA